MLWFVFAAVVLAMLALDLGVFHRRAHAIGFREALGWSAAWFTLAVVFAGIVYQWRGPDDGLAFFAGYLIEWSLSADNVFVFLMIFTYFRVPAQYQHRVLFWGIVGAVVMRAILVTAGVVLINRVHAIVYVFGAFLIITGLRMAFAGDVEIHPEKNPVLRMARWLFPVSNDFDGQRFTTRLNGRLA